MYVHFAHPPLDHSEQLRLSEEELGERVLRGERTVHLSLPAGPTRKRKPLTEEQLLERRRKVRFSKLLQYMKWIPFYV